MHHAWMEPLEQSVTFLALGSRWWTSAGFAPASQEQRNPFQCLSSASDALQGRREITLVSAALYRNRELIASRLRTVADAPDGSANDVHVALAGLVYGDAPALAYKERRLGFSLQGRVSGLESEVSWAVMSLSSAVHELHTLKTTPDDLASLGPLTVQNEVVKLHVLRDLYTIPFDRAAWRRVDRPIPVRVKRWDAQHIEAISRLFDVVVQAGADPGCGLPAPDDPEFQERILEPCREAFDDDRSFRFVVRLLLIQLLEAGKSLASLSDETDPSYRPNWERALSHASAFMGPLRDDVQDEVRRWRHLEAFRNIADIYCNRAPGKPLEVIAPAFDVEKLHELLVQALGPDVPVKVKDITDYR